ncbi:hypothetical protein [Marinoscillum sp. MHG1-6]|uniref:hypothetical protein n=1 Tax=Marinoscillum sp. MHG1-6 TaxID=2959627 RepID=UPI0021579890|nr:hypothetical protein [Marinoscillum sp. MHG1-6]
MEIKYTKQFLNRLEDIFSETDYILRYEKGNFQSGYCVLKETKIAIVNKYYSLDGKINSLLEILKSVELDISGLSDKNRKLYFEINSTQLQF